VDAVSVQKIAADAVRARSADPGSLYAAVELAIELAGRAGGRSR